MHARRLWPLLLLGALLFTGFCALGTWQLQRLGWKQSLIAQVEQQLAAPAVAAPGPEVWPSLGKADAYRRVAVRGVFDHSRAACTLAVTATGSGCWLLTPLRTEAGWWLLVNRGFIASAPSTVRSSPEYAAGNAALGTETITGLMRLSEPEGGFLRRNQPAAERWYSRDVTALAHARGLPATTTAPYFIDAETQSKGGPKAGLTVVRFTNNHLAYALTWFAMAAGVVVATVLAIKHARLPRA